MLAITLDPHQNINTYQANQSDDWHFQAKVINDGLFAEVRVSFIHTEGKKKFHSKNNQDNFLSQKNIQE